MEFFGHRPAGPRHQEEREYPPALALAAVPQRELLLAPPLKQKAG
jgi:hypothetical protein